MFNMLLSARSRLVVAGLATTCLALSIPTAASAKPPTPISSGVKYVAMGSSYAAGTALPGSPGVIDAGCGRKDSNYAHQIAAELRLDLKDVSCGGATIDNIVDTPQTARDGSVRAPQIEAVTADTKLVTITVGGNDVRFVTNLGAYTCEADPSLIPEPLRDRYCGTVDRAQTDRLLAEVSQELTNMITAIQIKAPEARVVVVDYITVLPQNGQTCSVMPISGDNARYMLETARKLQLATKHATQQTGAELVELSKASRQHDACSSDPWAYGWGALSYHPNDAGHTAAADLVVQQLRFPPTVK
jgi:lysophospholipase L1-like esterase